jgi:hypothetical protein
VFYTTDPQDRAEFIAALRSLADFLASNTSVPVPLYGAEINLCADSYEDDGKAQVDYFAHLVSASVTDDTPEGHYEAVRSFGCISYRIVSICDTYTARRDAERSYENNVVFDPDVARRVDPYSLTDCGNPQCTRQKPCDECSQVISKASVCASQEASWL